MSSPNNQHVSRYGVGKWSRNKESCFCKVKWKKQLNAIYHEIQQKPCSFEYCNVFCPENRVSSQWPANFSPQGTFDDGLPDIVMTPFNHTICLWVVRGDADMVDSISVCKNIECLYIWSSIVSDQLGDGSPATKDVLENKWCDRGRILRAKHAPFGICSKSTLGLNDEMIPAEVGHYHDVNVYFAE